MNYNEILKKLVKEQIGILKNQKRALEINKDFRKIPLCLKESYYYGYRTAMDSLYDILNDTTVGSHVSFEEYQNVLEMVSIVEDYLINILDNYGIRYEIV